MDNRHHTASNQEHNRMNLTQAAKVKSGDTLTVKKSTLNRFSGQTVKVLEVHKDKYERVPYLFKVQSPDGLSSPEMNFGFFKNQII